MSSAATLLGPGGAAASAWIARGGRMTVVTRQPVKACVWARPALGTGWFSLLPTLTLTSRAPSALERPVSYVWVLGLVFAIFTESA